MRLRDYQQDIIDRTRSEMKKGHKSVFICLSTGAGKTIIATQMLLNAYNKKLTAYFMAHRREIIDQTSRAFSNVGMDHGIISAQHKYTLGKKINICSVQTAHRRKNLIEPALCFWDEADLIGSKSWTNLYRSFPNSYHVLLSATPRRLDGKPLSEYATSMVMGPPMEWLIEQGYLSKYKAYAPSKADLTGVHTRMGDYITSELSQAMDKPAITGCAIAEYKKLSLNKRAVAFCVSIEHSKNVAKAYNDAGIPAAHLDGESSDRERAAVLNLFRQDKIKVISNVDLFTRGLDIPAAQTAILLRPTKSLALYLQMVGRVLRPDEDKPHALILDHAGNVESHGLPCEDREWTLEGKQKKTASIGVKICPSCFAAVKQGTKACTSCGHVFHIEHKGREIDEVDGTLSEINIDEYKSRARKNFWREAYAVDDMSELKGLCVRYGYKPGYAYKVMEFKRKKRTGPKTSP
jgi:superfamily II DNA or RNA helicase